MKFCPKCGAALEDQDRFCLDCATSRRSLVAEKPEAEPRFSWLSEDSRPQAKPSANVVLSIRQVLALGGSVVLALGVFAPLVSLPLVGSLNYFQNGHGDGVLVLIFAMSAFVEALTKNYRWLWVSGLGSLATITFAFITFQAKLSEISSNTNTELAGDPLKGLTDLALQSVQLQWGWALLMLGTLALLVAAAMREDQSYPDHDLRTSESRA